MRPILGLIVAGVIVSPTPPIPLAEVTMSPVQTSEASVSISRSLRRILSSLALGCLFLTACERQPLPIGVVLPESGTDAAYGTSARRGMELAHDHLRQQGAATHLDLHFRDSQSSPEQALGHFRQLIEDKALVTIGGFTPAEALALAPVAAEAERVVLSPTSQDHLLGSENPFFYRMAPSAAVTGTTIATFAAQDLDLETLVLLAETRSQGDALEDGLGANFDRLGGEPITRVDADATPLDEAARAISGQAPDAVALAGWGGWLATAVDALRDARYRGKIFVPESFAAPSVRSAVGAAGRGVLIASSPFDAAATTEPTRTFVTAYRERYGQEPDLYAAAGWDTMLVLAAALADRPNLPGEVRQWLRDDVKEIAGVTGHLQFDDTGAITKYPRVYSLARDLSLRDHGRWLEQEKQRIAEERRRLEKERREILERLRSGAAAEEDAGEADEEGFGAGSQVASSG